ncbi:MAG TPA: GspE/PulE family protein [Candidatus Paceibacterota bacterium]|nr:GspE/PulE family protein [Candidatus Paceibacterota bacterium]HRZ34221.1 GspE/PulE family protein [Candidatus Paceibacterota bacterium]
MVLKFDEEKQNSRVAELRQKESEDLAQYMASKYGIPYVNLSEITIDTNALRLIREDEARSAQVAGFQLFNKKLGLAVLSAQSEAVQKIVEDFNAQGYNVQLAICSPSSLEHAWTRYKDISFATATDAGTLDVASDFVEEFIKKVRSIDGARKLIEDVKQMKKSFRVSRIVEIVVAAAIASKSSDIHVEPEEESITVRFRIDGVLTKVTSLDFETYNLLLSRIKLLSGLKLNIKNQAQNGRFSVKIGEIEFEIRTSTLPGNNGESIVMRLLDPNSLSVPLTDLGIPQKLLGLLNKEIEKPNGLILNTGPTGSGKTTALYAFLSRIKNPGIKIITIEDPIEYHLTGVVQTQVDQHKNYDFASGLKNSLRQDPDVIMVGEIRDNDTAETAVQAALTGHLVLSTLHTNSAAGAFPRLTDLGVDPKITTSAVNVVIAQRLVRRICKHCGKKVKISSDKIERVKKCYDGIVDRDIPAWSEEVYEAQGCEKCNNTGYSGRIGIFEAIFMDKKVEAAVHSIASEDEIAETARPQGVMNMQEDGLVKILDGITTIDEVERVVGSF